MDSIDALIEEIVKAHGYEVQNRTRGGFSAKKGEESLYVGIEVEHVVDSRRVLELMATYTADRYLFVCLKGFSKDQGLLSSEDSVQLWDRGHLEIAVGRATVASLIGEELSDIFDTTTKNGPELEIDGFEIDIGREESAPLFLENTDAQGERILKPQVSLEDMAATSKAKVSGFRFSLELVPYHIFEFVCELVADGWSRSKSMSGFVAVNALTAEAEFWRGGFETVGTLEASHTKLEPKIAEAEGRQAAYHHALEKTTSTIEDVDDRGTVTIFEKKKVQPKDGRIDLHYMGIIYLPLWCVEGTAGTMIVNAVNGRVVQEKLYSHQDI